MPDSPPAVISGLSGMVNGAEAVGQWDIEYKADANAFVASNTKGGTGVLAGNGDWSGSYKALGHTPAVFPGADLSFVGSVDGTNGVTGTAIVDEVEITWDQKSGKAIEHTVKFSGNGTLSRGAAAAADSSVANPPSSLQCKLMLDSAEVTDVETMKLTFKRDNKAYTSSSTAGGTKRLKGPLSGTFSASVLTGSLAGLPAVKTNAVAKLYVGTSTYWEITWVYINSVKPSINVETAEPVGASIDGAFNGFVGGVAGTIKTPASSTLWPEA